MSGLAPATKGTARSVAWYGLGVLCLAALLSQLDRQLTSLIVAPLKSEFGLSDTQFGLLHGYGFALTYAVAGLPFGLLVDRANRRNIIFAGLLAWSALTMLAGFAGSFTQLFLFRAGVGIGEAVLSPAAYSMIVDYFPAQRRGRAIAVYYIALAVGGGGSLILGGMLLKAMPPTGVAFHGVDLSPWRALFVAAGLPGLLIALLVLTVREPRRAGDVVGERATLADFFRFVGANSGPLGRVSLASIMVTMAGYGAAAWAPALFERRFGLATPDSAAMIGAAMIGGSIVGPLVGGSLSDRLSARGENNARSRVMLVGYLALLPASWWSVMSSPTLALMLFTVVMFCVGVVQSAMPLALQEAVPPRMRGQIIALQLMLVGLFSFGLGPSLVALITDRVLGADMLLPWSLVLVSMPLAVAGSLLCWFGLRKTCDAPSK